MTDNFGTVTYQGETIYLDEQAEPTSRVLTEYGDNGEYENSRVWEWAADGHRENGEEVRVYWHFEVAREDCEATDGVYPYEAEPDTYDWNNVERVTVR